MRGCQLACDVGGDHRIDRKLKVKLVTSIVGFIGARKRKREDKKEKERKKKKKKKKRKEKKRKKNQFNGFDTAALFLKRSELLLFV